MQRRLGHGRLTRASSSDGTAAEAGLSGGFDEDGIFNADFLSVRVEPGEWLIRRLLLEVTRERDDYPWPSLMAFVYGARKDMPLEPLEFLSALLLWSASVPTGFRQVGRLQREKGTEKIVAPCIKG